MSFTGGRVSNATGSASTTILEGVERKLEGVDLRWPEGVDWKIPEGVSFVCAVVVASVVSKSRARPIDISNENNIRLTTASSILMVTQIQKGVQKSSCGVFKQMPPHFTDFQPLCYISIPKATRGIRVLLLFLSKSTSAETLDMTCMVFTFTD